MDDNFDRDHITQEYAPAKSYALSGKIMLSAIVILLAVVIFMVCLHIYARWYLLRARRRQYLRRSRPRTHLVFYVDTNNPNAASTVRGLDASVLGTLPVFVYSSKTHTDVPECAVCLSEFEENEKGRLLPKCKHSFHLDCIDMWFHSHSTCPLCRSPVESEISVSASESPSDVVLSVSQSIEPEPSSSSGMCSACHQDGEQSSIASSSSSSSSPRGRRKGLELVGVTIERLLSISKRSAPALSPTSACGDTELDIERGRDESRQQSRAQTPR